MILTDVAHKWRHMPSANRVTCICSALTSPHIFSSHLRPRHRSPRRLSSCCIDFSSPCTQPASSTSKFLSTCIYSCKLPRPTRAPTTTIVRLQPHSRHTRSPPPSALKSPTRHTTTPHICSLLFRAFTKDPIIQQSQARWPTSTTPMHRKTRSTQPTIRLTPNHLRHQAQAFRSTRTSKQLPRSWIRTSSFT
jgi:hypothetical protein